MRKVEAGKKEDALKIEDLKEGNYELILCLRCGEILQIEKGRVVLKDGVKSLESPGRVFHSQTRVLESKKIKFKNNAPTTAIKTKKEVSREF